jgi:hypothetical protein
MGKISLMPLRYNFRTGAAALRAVLQCRSFAAIREETVLGGGAGLPE